VTNKALLLAATLLCMVACAGSADTPNRKQLTHDQLVSGDQSLESPVANHYFMPIDGAPAQHQFSGAIAISEHAMRTDPDAIQPADIRGRQTQLFPGVSLQFVSHGDQLIPVERDVIVPPDGDSYWHIQVEPGRVWSEPDDKGMSRASFPFLLTNLFENETYNGLATFLYDDESVSELRYQIVQQLSPFMLTTKVIAWNQRPITYQAKNLAAEQLLTDFDEELADRLVWRDWSELEEKYGPEVLDDFDSGIDPGLVAAAGLVIDGAGKTG